MSPAAGHVRSDPSNDHTLFRRRDVFINPSPQVTYASWKEKNKFRKGLISFGYRGNQNYPSLIRVIEESFGGYVQTNSNIDRLAMSQLENI